MFKIPQPLWFPGGELNTCYNAVDRHVEAGHGDRLAIVYDSPIAEAVTKMTYAELLAQVNMIVGYNVHKKKINFEKLLTKKN